MAGSYALASCLAYPNPLQPPGFILPCQPALADSPPSGPGWLQEIKWDGHRVIARKDGEQVRLWARTTSDYSRRSHAFAMCFNELSNNGNVQNGRFGTRNAQNGQLVYSTIS